MSKILWLLWAIVLLEILSPVPAFLSLGAVWVLVARPPWFPALVRRLYEGPHVDPASEKGTGEP